MGCFVISVANQKGGVGKTTTSVNLASAIASLGKRVLIIDMDPQGNATSGLGLEKLPGMSIYAPLLGESDLDSKIQITGFQNLWAITSEPDLCGAEIELPQTDNHIEKARICISKVVNLGKFDLIFIDCPPSLGVLTINALVASDYVLVPLQCEYYALEGVSMMTRLLEKLNIGLSGKAPKVLGFLMTMFDGRTRLSHQVVNEMRQHFGQLVFETVIPRTTRLAEAPSFGKPISYYDPYSVATSAFDVLAQEVLNRIYNQNSAAQLEISNNARSDNATDHIQDG